MLGNFVKGDKKNLAAKKKKRRDFRSLEEEEIEALMNTKGGNIEIDPYITERGEKTGEVVILMMTFRHHIQKQDT